MKFTSQNKVVTNYNQTLKIITSRIKQGQYNALKIVNTELINLYRDIGRIVSEARIKGKWGDNVIEKLMRDINSENPGIKGFSRSNIFNMIRFYQEYKDNEFVQPLAGQISWTHNVIILDKCKTLHKRYYYIEMTAKYGWSKRLLINKIALNDYERSLRSQNNFGRTLKPNVLQQARSTVKDEYIFNFLDLDREYSEKEFENSIVRSLEKFLIEMNHNFHFVGRQYKFEVDEQEFFIDLLLYHRPLKCFVAVDLKIGAFKPEYAGKMAFYLTALDRQVKTKDENNSIGIIVCKEKNRTLVEYALSDINKPLAVATYTSHAQLPDKYSKYLPNEEEIVKRLVN